MLIIHEMSGFVKGNAGNPRAAEFAPPLPRSGNAARMSAAPVPSVRLPITAEREKRKIIIEKR